MRHPPTHEEIHDKKTARHRRDTHQAREILQLTLSRISNLKSNVFNRVVLPASVLSCLALAAMAGSSAATDDPGGATVAQASAAGAAADPAARSTQRAAADQSTKAAGSTADRAAP